MDAPLLHAYQTQGYKPEHLANDIGWTSYGVRDPIVRAYDDGVVVESLYTTVGGNTISIRHADDSGFYYLTRYVHLKSRAVLKGDKVVSGQTIGIGGTTGTSSTGPHLHFEIWVCPTTFVYTTNLYVNRVKYAKDPAELLFLQGAVIKGGYPVMSLKIDLARQLTAKTKVAVNLRDKPTTAGIVLGLAPLNTPIICLGVTEVINGYEWLVFYHNNRLCYSAAKFYELVYPVGPTVTIEKIVEKIVEKPVAVHVLQDGLVIDIKSELKV
jgi:hypothetical protein